MSAYTVAVTRGKKLVIIIGQPKALAILPLPNMETKFVAANTLISLEKPSQLMLTLNQKQIDEKENELKAVRNKYFTASNQTVKQKYIIEDERLRKEIAGLRKEDGCPIATANQVAAWDPYDTTKSSDFLNLYGCLELRMDLIFA